MKGPLFLGLDEVMEIHRDQIDRYGGSPGIRDIKLLESAVATPAAGFGEDYLHTNIYEMAAAYLFHIIRNHPFTDGNKRTGAVAAIVFLMMNGIELHAGEDGLEKMVRSVAEGKMGKTGAAAFFRKHASKGKHE
ncbi:MAG: type II toxin-antitoxin system death-on-curing family toxin [Deltaproteobacteria bacterium]